MTNIFFEGFKTLYYGTLKKKVDRLIEKSLEFDNDTVIFALNGTLMNYYNAFYPMLSFFIDKRMTFIPLEHDFREEPDVSCYRLNEKISKIMHRYKKAVFLGHSYGGILAKYLVRKFIGDKKKIMVITVATPNKSMDIKPNLLSDRIICKLDGLLQPELRNNSILGYLKKNPLKKAKVVNIIARNDTLVPKKFTLIGSKKPDIIIDEDHLSILYSKELFVKVYGIIEKG